MSQWPSWPEVYRHCACDHTILIAVSKIAGKRLGLVVEVIEHATALELV